MTPIKETLNKHLTKLHTSAPSLEEAKYNIKTSPLEELDKHIEIYRNTLINHIKNQL